MTLVLLMTAATGAWAQTVVTIGNGTDDTSFVPYCSSYNNSLVEQIYLASEIGQSGIITAISFNIFEQQDDITNSVDVYMKNVTRSSFSSTTDYEPLAASDMVFSGSVNYKQDGWNTITLDTPFEYDNTKNLLICLYKKGSTKYSIYNYYTTQTENRTIAFYHDTNVPDPYNLGSYPKFISVVTNRADIKITMEDLPAPTYSVTMKDGVKDADKWTITPNEGLKGDGSETVTLKYNGRLKVKSVTAVSDEKPKPAATVTTKPTATTGLTTVSAVTEKLVTAGVADGGELKYAITSTTTLPDDAAFTLTISPTVSDLKTALSMSTLAAGTYYVWYKVFADDDHADSEAAYVSVSVTVAQVITWNNSNVFVEDNQNNIVSKFNNTSKTFEGITISFTGNQAASSFSPYQSAFPGNAKLQVQGASGDYFTFTAPAGKQFVKIEIYTTGVFTAFGDWSKANSNSPITWSGTASNTVNFDPSSNYASTYITSIAFTVKDAD